MLWLPWMGVLAGSFVGTKMLEMALKRKVSLSLSLTLTLTMTLTLTLTVRRWR
jgi:hypothetical protein